MITLDYRLDPEWNAKSVVEDLSTADEETLRYWAVFGDQVFRVGAADFSAPWGWVTLLDFAANLGAAARSLAAGGDEATIPFTESEAAIYLKREGQSVEITSNYVDHSAIVDLGELAAASATYGRRLLREVSAAFPDLQRNESLRSWFLKAVGS